jgi:hypothetical protein
VRFDQPLAEQPQVEKNLLVTGSFFGTDPEITRKLRSNTGEVLESFLQR